MPSYQPVQETPFFDQYFQAQTQIPAGFMSINQMAEAYSVNRQVISRRMNTLLATGEVARVFVRAPDKQGKMVETAFYGPPTRQEPGH